MDRLYFVLQKAGSPFALFGMDQGRFGPVTDEEAARKMADILDGIVIGVDISYVATARTPEASDGP